MPEEPDDLDPAANTQMFQAFVDRREADEQQAKKRREPRASGSRSIRAALAVLVALVIMLALAWVVLGR